MLMSWQRCVGKRLKRLSGLEPQWEPAQGPVGQVGQCPLSVLPPLTRGSRRTLGPWAEGCMRERRNRPLNLITVRVEALVSRPQGPHMIRATVKLRMSRVPLGSPGGMIIISARASKVTR